MSIISSFNKEKDRSRIQSITIAHSYFETVK